MLLFFLLIPQHTILVITGLYFIMVMCIRQALRRPSKSSPPGVHALM